MKISAKSSEILLAAVFLNSSLICKEWGLVFGISIGCPKYIRKKKLPIVKEIRKIGDFKREMGRCYYEKVDQYVETFAVNLYFG